jgi:hypothetical protein
MTEEVLKAQNEEFRKENITLKITIEQIQDRNGKL